MKILIASPNVDWVPAIYRSMGVQIIALPILPILQPLAWSLNVPLQPVAPSHVHVFQILMKEHRT